MTDKPYSKREIDSHHELIMNALNGFREETGKSLLIIQKAVNKTNGSVANLKLWRAYLTGAWAVVMIFLIPVIFYLSKTTLETQASVLSFQSQLDNYTIE